MARGQIFYHMVYHTVPYGIPCVTIPCPDTVGNPIDKCRAVVCSRVCCPAHALPANSTPVAPCAADPRGYTVPRVLTVLRLAHQQAQPEHGGASQAPRGGPNHTMGSGDGPCHPGHRPGPRGPPSHRPVPSPAAPQLPSARSAAAFACAAARASAASADLGTTSCQWQGCP